MKVILALGIFWTLYGFAGVMGFQVINEKYRNHDWTASYIRYCGKSWLMMGIPWIILYLLTHDKDIGKVALCLLILLCSTPSLVYTIINERKYKQMLKEK